MNFANAKKIGVLSAAAGVICVLLMKQLKQKTKKKRRIWSEKWLLKRQDGRGVLHMLEQELRTEDPESYRQFIRMCGQHFDELLECIRSDIVKQTTNMRESISAEARLALTLRFLATGETYRSLMFATRIHESTISLIIPDVCNAICEKLKSVNLQDNIGKLKKLTDMQGGNRAASEALEARNLFSRFFVTNGAVPWQNDVL
ncbi:hypothetical protein PPYR_01266 [Photinus pyralis]|uniref:Uncharacterized protein n=1 Tax=Photinus pyralis TaxID=7054 RepID=A0A5N4B407_PHOPY|nr:hypothetical protein PPYR_01266 [Photinus pyralis]